jgi:hypothetical protein
MTKTKLALAAIAATLAFSASPAGVASAGASPTPRATIRKIMATDIVPAAALEKIGRYGPAWALLDRATKELHETYPAPSYRNAYFAFIYANVMLSSVCDSLRRSPPTGTPAQTELAVTSLLTLFDTAMTVARYAEVALIQAMP